MTIYDSIEYNGNRNLHIVCLFLFVFFSGILLAKVLVYTTNNKLEKLVGPGISIQFITMYEGRSRMCRDANGGSGIWTMSAVWEFWDC